MIPGIFREEGSSNDVTVLFEYYAKHPRPVHGNQLPSYMNYTVHEVGTAYKRVVKGLPGGLLGSSELLGVLKDISLHVNQDGRLSEKQATALRIHLIALALSCVHSDNRFSVICATLGLYAWIGHATEASEGGPANMNCKNLSNLLGPLLIGEELNDIKGVRPAPGAQIDAKQVAAMMASNQDAIAIAFMLITNWKAIVEELRDFAVNAAAILRHEEEGRRLANSQSQYTLHSTDAPVQERQPPDFLNEPAVAGNKLKISQSILHPLKNFRSFSKDKAPKPDPLDTESASLDSPRRFRIAEWVADGTGGFVSTRTLHRANDGNKTRGATSRRSKHTKPKTKVVDTTVRHRSVHPYGRSDPEEQMETASAPAVNYASVHQAARHRHIGIANGHEITPERQPRVGPTYETHDQPEDDFLDEEIPSEDRISDYEALLSSEASQSDRGEIDAGERFGDGGSFSVNENSENESEQDERLHNGLRELASEYRESYLHLEAYKRGYRSSEVRNTKDQEDLTSYENQAAEALGQPATADSVTSSQSGSVRQMAQRIEEQIQQHSQVHESSSDSELPYVENFETPTPRARNTEEGSKLPLVKSSENTPTPRARSLIPKYVGGSNTAQMTPPIYRAPISNQAPQYFMSGALHPDDMPSRRPLSPIRVPNPLNFLDPPSARRVEHSKALSNRMTTPAFSSQSSSLLQLDQTVVDKIPARPMTLDFNNTFAHHHAESHSQPRYSASQDGDDYAYSASEYTDHSANRDSIDSDRRAESMGYLEDEVTEEELARRQTMCAEIHDRRVRKMKAEYDHYVLGKQANYLKLTGRMSYSTLHTMTSQEYIEKNNWHVEEQGPPPRQRTRAERHMDEDTDVIIHEKRQFDGFSHLEASHRREMQPFMEKVLAAREPKSEATLAKELEEFKVKIERCRAWNEEKTARELAYKAERKKERAAFEALSVEEKRALGDRRAKEKLEKICREADEKRAAKKRAAKKEHRWSRKRKGSGDKSGEKSGDSGESKTKQGINRPGIRGGKVSALRKFFGSGLRKGS